jgi:hypothetical protein
LEIYLMDTEEDHEEEKRRGGGAAAESRAPTLILARPSH